VTEFKRKNRVVLFMEQKIEPVQFKLVLADDNDIKHLWMRPNCPLYKDGYAGRYWMKHYTRYH